MIRHFRGIWNIQIKLPVGSTKKNRPFISGGLVDILFLPIVINTQYIYGYAELHSKTIFKSRMCHFEARPTFKLDLNMFLAFGEGRQYKQTNLLDKSDNECGFSVEN